MLDFISRWYKSRFDSMETAVFILVLVVVFLFLSFFGAILAPLLAGIVIAFILDTPVKFLHRYLKISQTLSVIIVFLVFLAFVCAIFLFLVPMIIHQAVELARSLPDIYTSFKTQLYALSERYPQYLSTTQIDSILNAGANVQMARLASFGKTLVSLSISSLPSVVYLLVYAFLVPLSVFFYLKDKQQLIHWVTGLLPQQRGAVIQVWDELKPQLSNYVKGKCFELIIVGTVTYIGFIIFGMNYALLLAVGVGLSVIIPYVGMVIITIPVVIVAVMQFGLSMTLVYVLLVYFIIQALDGNVLVPLLFSEAVNLHPIAVIAAVLFFGGIWGFWGLFFAIPLASLVKATVNVCFAHIQRANRKNRQVSALTSA
ncbi:AI-2E family transporter [Thiotrichales bacterium 19S3-7]|nr:AI-2E family transporter [Thiotrichales bacterium 19S3-7]MCF6801397.1 AI-2E family transporter [Thiotrichales bacterium 19S3-11]